MRWLLVCLMCLWPAVLTAQTSDDDRGYIQGLLEDALSGDGRSVRMEGFAGALSSRATIDRIVVEDPDGIWLEARDVAMTWTRRALLRGEIEIDEISVGVLSVPRLPAPSDAPPSPEAGSAFALPELPVSVDLRILQFDRVELGEPLFGEAAVMQVKGSASLAGGAGQAALTVERLDKGGAFRFEGAYSNATRILGLDLSLREPADGIAVNLLNLPGLPSVALSLQGEAPIDDFEGRLRLDTDGRERLAGTVILRADGDGDAASRRFRLDVAGDVAPVFLPEYREFLGRDVRLVAEASQEADGRLVLSELDLAAQALRLRGNASIGADGWPERLDLAGRIVPPNGERVLLPLGGAKTYVDGVTLTGRFDASSNDGWQIRASVRGLDRDGTQAQSLSFSGAGTLSRAQTQVSGDLTLAADGLDFGNADFARAVGESLRGALSFEWRPDQMLSLRDLDLSGADYGLTGSVNVFDIADGIDPVVAPDFVLSARDLRRFAGVAGMDLSGAADLRISGTGAPISGAFDLDFAGSTRDLGTGIAQLDPLLVGNGQIVLSARRDDAGLVADEIRISTDHARIDGTAALATGRSSADITAEITQTARIFPDLDGRSRLNVSAAQDAEIWRVTVDGAIPGGTLAYDGTISGDGETSLAIAGRLDAALSRLSAFSDLAGRDLAGAAELSVQGSGDVLAQSFSGTVRGNLNNVALSVPTIDPLLKGNVSFSAEGARDAAGIFDIRRVQLDGPANLRFDGRIAGDGQTQMIAQGQLSANVPDLAPFSGLAGQALSGAVTLSADGQADLFAQTFAARLRAETRDVRGVSGQVDPVLQGRTVVQMQATRDAAGVLDVAQLDLTGLVNAQFIGQITGSTAQDLGIVGRLNGDIPRLSALSGLTGQSLGGAARFSAQADGALVDGPLAVNADVSVDGLRIGNATVDPLLGGTTDVRLQAQRGADGVLRISRAVVDASGVDLTASGEVGPNSGSVSYDLSLPDLGRIVPELPGPASLTGVASLAGGRWQVNASGTGPADIGATASGSIAQDFGRLDLALSGSAPLSLANAQLSPRVLSGILRFDVSVNGPPALSSVSGRVSTSDARLSLPDLKLLLTDIGGEVVLSGNRAQVDMRARLDTGGRVRVTGPIALAAPFASTLTAELSNAKLRDGALYETTADGRVQVSGPLTGGARISGDITLGTVEVRIPQIGPSYKILDGLEHVRPPADVQRTLQFAGLSGRDDPQAGGNVPDFPLDLTIRAPNRLFVRGRGLDAELGGTLRLTGTTNNILPVGQFDLVRGRLDLLGRRLVLSEGAVSLRGSFDPVIRFVATSEVEDVQITLGIEGVASSPDLLISSVPDLPQDQILALFLFGRDFTQLSALQAVQLAAAVRTLTGQGGLGLTDQLRSGLGIDDLDIGTDADGKAQARVGKYISDNIYTDVTVNSDGKSEINLNLNLTPNVTVRGRLGSDGDSGVGVFFEKDY